ncbi:MAG: hypothetical protein FWG45_02340 [Oscillospiraceae bacterium]|nr:hypothetical protein [Oscillospiraceae bacterium]
MKTKKCFFTTVVATLLLVSLGGCSELQRNESDSSLAVDRVEASYAPLVILGSDRNAEKVDFKNELVAAIQSSRSMSKNDERHGTYSINKISEITEFYFPTHEIDGFEMSCLGVLSGAFTFDYAPLNPTDEMLDKNGNYCFSMDSAIQLSIVREGAFDDIPSPPTLGSIARGGGEIRGDFVYDDSPYHTLIAGLIGDTWFYMYVPKELNEFETLRDMANQVVKSAELVKVK